MMLDLPTVFSYYNEFLLFCSMEKFHSPIFLLVFVWSYDYFILISYLG